MEAKTARFAALILALTLVAAGSGPLAAQEVPAGAEEGQPDDIITIRVKEDGMELEEALAWASETTKRMFLYGQNTLQSKKIFMPGIAHIRRDQVYEFWQAVFATQGFAMVPISDFVLVENIDQSRQLKQRAAYVPVQDLADYQNKVGEVIMTTIPLDYVNVVAVRTAVSAILQNRAAEFIQDIASSNSLIVVGFGPTVYAIYQLCMAMDVPTPSATLKFEIIELKNAVASEMVNLVRDLLPSDQGAPGRPPVRGEGVLPGQEKPEPKVIADPRMNALVVYAIEVDMNEIKRLVAALDTEVTQIESNIHIYFLRNTNAEDMAETLRQVTGQGSTRSGRAGAGIRGGAGQQPATTSEYGQDISIVPDTNTNSLLIQATRTKFEEIVPIIEKLDRRRPQVLVQAAIAELSDSDVQSIGVEITAIQGGNNKYKLAGATGFGLSMITVDPTSGGTTGTGGTGTGTGGGTAGATGSTGSLFSDLIRVPFATSSGGIAFSGLAAGIFQEDLNVPLLVNLLKTTTKGNLVSVPSVLTNDNESSFIRVGTSVPTAQVNQGQFSDQTSFGGYENADLTLRISPHISNDNYLRLEIQLIVEAFVPGSSTSLAIPPARTTREFVGNVTVPNGSTVVIGGLVQDNETEAVSKVPFLGDIPVIGELFKTTTTTKQKNTLYLFVTPTILNEFRALEDISYQRKLEIHKLAGNVRLVDPSFREVDLDDGSLDLDEIERSGNLDLPAYTPVSSLEPQARTMPVTGIPVKPNGRTDEGVPEIGELPVGPDSGRRPASKTDGR